MIRIPVEVGSPEWHEARRQGVTASEIAGILGIAPDNWTSPFNLYHRKTGAVDDDRDNAAMEMGRELEGIVLRRFAREHPEFLVTEGGLFRHHARAWQMATPDGLAYESGGDLAAVVQAKTAGSRDHWGEPGTDEIPAYYIAQVRWEMDVMGVDVAYVPVLFGGRDYQEYVVRQDAADLELMLDEAQAFMRLLEAGTPPPVDWRESTTWTLKRLHPDLEDTEVELPHEWVRAYLQAQIDKADAETRMREAENNLRAAMGSARTGVVAGRKVVTRARYTVKEHVRRASEVDRLYITKMKEDDSQ